MPKIIQLVSHVRDCYADGPDVVEHELLALDDEGNVWHIIPGEIDEAGKYHRPWWSRMNIAPPGQADD